jgi:hypothetical protein
MSTELKQKLIKHALEDQGGKESVILRDETYQILNERLT